MGRKIRLEYRESWEPTNEETRLSRYVIQGPEDGWLAEAKLRVRGGRAEIVSLLITHEAGEEAAPAGGLRRRTLDEVHLRAIREYGTSSLSARAEIRSQ